MDTARNNGISRFISDTNIALIQKYAPQRSNYKGTEEQTYMTNRAINHTYAGVRMRTANVVERGLSETHKFKTIFSGTDTFNLFIYNNLNELLHTVSINTIMTNSVTNNLVNITLLMWDKDTGT